MISRYSYKSNIISFRTIKKVMLSFIFIFIFDVLLFPAPVFASEYENFNNTVRKESGVIIEPAVEEINSIIINNTLPMNSEWKIVKAGNYEITAYTSEASQTDGSPCTTANGFNLCQHGEEDSIAANFLKFGTKVKIPELFGDKVFVVRDRMNSRYQNRIDIWMKDKSNALKFGFKYGRVEILAEP